MQINVLEYLEASAFRLPEKTAFADAAESLGFEQLLRASRAIGSALCRKGIYKEPVVVFMQKAPKEIAAFFGVVYGGCYYVPIDEEMPRLRIQMILDSLPARLMICDEKTMAAARDLSFSGEQLLYEELASEPVNQGALALVRERAIDTDPLYIVFTSGSTGVPKGVTASHRCVMDYIESLDEVLKTGEDTVFGNQTPLYVDASLKEVYSTIRCGSTTWLIPKSLFSFPVKLVEYLNEHKINTVCWVVSALTMISSFGTFDTVKLETLHTIAFGSEVFPIKQFRIWREHLKDARFINLYGPTEATGMCCYYEVDREFELDEAIPIGRPFKNREILLLNGQGKAAAPGETGEICVRGSALGLGYYRNPEKTSESFVQNPLHCDYPDLVYKTGDLARYNSRGELVFVSRKDYQIKHMGYRIELGEIEMNVNALEGISMACCLYNREKDRIVLFYVGSLEPKDVVQQMKQRVPRYMVPNRMVRLERMPLTANGKIDRVSLKEQIQ